MPAFGYESEFGVDRRHRLIRTWLATDASRHGGAQPLDLVSEASTAGDVWTDMAYRPKANEAYLADNGPRSRIHRREPQGRPMPANMARADNPPVKGAGGSGARLRPADGDDGAGGAHDRSAWRGPS